MIIVDLTVAFFFTQRAAYKFPLLMVPLTLFLVAVDFTILWIYHNMINPLLLDC